MQKIVLFAAFCLIIPNRGTAAESAFNVSVDVVVEGFDSDDGETSDQTYLLQWRQMPRFPNLAAYFDLTNFVCLNGRGCFATVRTAARPLEDAGDSVPERTAYAPSKLVNPLDATVSRWAERIAAQPSRTTSALVLDILARVQSFVVYPEDGVSLRSTTDEIMSASRLNRVVGDCKTYSNLFVALARRLGLRARMVTGYLVSRVGAEGHVWVEVKVGDVWYPVEPQDPAGHVTPKHVPTGVVGEDGLAEPSSREDRLVRVRQRP